MKKTISVLLCLTFLILALTACGGGSSSQTEADRPYLTLRMAIVVSDDQETTQEGIEAMQKAFNAKSEVLLATRIEFECIKASEYRERMDAIMNEIEDERARQDAAVEDSMANAGNSTGTEINKNESTEFPAASKTQFDILLIADEEMYNEYIEKGWIVKLGSHINPQSGTFKVLNTKIPTSAKNAAFDKVNEDYFGIPANKAYGTYKYLLLNKEAADCYNIDPKNVSSLADVHGLLASMEIASAGNGLSKWTEKYGSDFSVILNTQDEFVMPNVQYLSQNFTDFSLIGATYGYASTIAEQENASNLLTNPEYKKFLTAKYMAQENGYFGDGTATNFLIGIQEGDYNLRNANPDYYYCPIMYPILEREDIFGGMLAVSKFSVNEKRSVEIIQELMTNATKENLLNIALFGDQQSNYYLENGCVVYRNASNYHVHPDYLFGGLREFAYPCAAFGQNANTYVYAQEQLKNLATRTPLFDEYIGTFFARVNADDWKQIDELSQTVYAELMASGKTTEEFLADIDEIVAELEANATFSHLDQSEASLNDFDLETLGGSFFKYVRDRIDGKTGEYKDAALEEEGGDTTEGGDTGAGTEGETTVA